MPSSRFVVVVGMVVMLMGLSAGTAVARQDVGVSASRAAATPTPSCSASGFGYDLCTVTFTDWGEQSYMLPYNLANPSVQVEAIGAAGQAGNPGSIGNSNLLTNGEDCWASAGSGTTGGGTPGSGGQGADVTGAITGAADETLYVDVGGPASYIPDVSGDVGTIDSIGGYNGGASGGPGATNGSFYCGGYGGGGGGASDVQTCQEYFLACRNTYGTSSDPRLIVAGGGGGGGGSGAQTYSPGFNGGGAGQNGTGDGSCCVIGGTAGANANGSGGTGGGPPSFGGVGGGGGGGGGYAGGGGGQSGSVGGAAGGGGGSNRVPAGGTQSLTNKPAQVILTYAITPPTTIVVSGSGHYGGPFTLTATLTSRGSVVPGKTIHFRIGSADECGASPLPSCPTTNSSGTATLSNVTLSGTPLPVGGYVMSASFYGDSSYDSSTGSGTLTISKAGSATTVVCTGTPFTYDGNAHGCAASWASTGSDGGNGALSTVTYTGRNGTTYNSTTAPTGAGDYSAAASFAGDSNHTGSNGSANFTIAKASQSITFGSIAARTYGDPVFNVNPTASSGLAVTVASSTTGVCTVASASPSPGWNVTIVGGGSCTLNATQAGNANYAAATTVPQSFTVNRANQSITFGAIANQKVAAAPFGVSPTATSGLAVALASNTTGVCTVSGYTVTIVGAATCSLTASQAGNTNYNAATSVTQTFDVVSGNLVKDGGFESPAKPAGSTTVSAGHKIGPWSVTAGSVDIAASYWQNAPGLQSLDLAGLAPGTISQTIALPYTATYTLKFKYAGNPEGAPVKKHMLITASAPSWGSPVSGSKVFDTTTTTTLAMGWKSGKLTFTGTAGDVVTLTFQDTDGGTAWGMTLDAVSMIAS